MVSGSTSALLEDARGRRSPVKIAAFTTPDDTAPNFVSGYPQTPIVTFFTAELFPLSASLSQR